jgi:Transcriptional regulator, AbiEi antitoxin
MCEEIAIAVIAARQHGVVTTAQLYGAGIDKDRVRRLIAAGWLHRIHRGVYAVGHPGLSTEGEWMAAVLACGEGAVLSHRSAAELWEMLKPPRGWIHVTVPTTSGRARRKGIVLHRCPSLPAAATTREKNIPVTSPSRTIQDLRRVVSPGLRRKAIRQAEYLKLDLGGIPSDRTRSELERAFLRLCRRHGIPQPEVNARLGPYTVDFLWRNQRLVVETDSYATHAGRRPSRTTVTASST